MRRLILLVAALWIGGYGLLWPRPASPHDPITTTVLFNREVVGIFERKCFQCHTAGNLSMPLTSYREARPWAQAIKEEVLERRMPPWPAVSGYGVFTNDNSLTTRETEFIVSWVDGGVPAGSEPLNIPVPEAIDWPHGRPDVVHQMPIPHTVPAEAKDDVVRVSVPTGLLTARWVDAVDFKPGDRRLVKSAFMYDGATGQWIGGWTPWHAAIRPPEATGFLLRAGSRIDLEIHYHGLETPAVDRSALGLRFSDRRPIYRASDLVIRSSPRRTPPDPERGEVRLQSQSTVDADSSVFAMRAELGPGGRSVEVAALKPDGEAEILLWIKSYRPEWPTPYVFRRPVFLPRGTRVVVTAYFEGSTDSSRTPFSRVTLSRSNERPSRLPGL